MIFNGINVVAGTPPPSGASITIGLWKGPAPTTSTTRIALGNLSSSNVWTTGPAGATFYRTHPLREGEYLFLDIAMNATGTVSDIVISLQFF